MLLRLCYSVRGSAVRSRPNNKQTKAFRPLRRAARRFASVCLSLSLFRSPAVFFFSFLFFFSYLSLTHASSDANVKLTPRFTFEASPM